MPSTSQVTPQALGLTALYADQDVAVYDKPTGLIVHRGAGNTGVTLSTHHLANFPIAVNTGDPERPGIIHRLDKDTSGLILTAITPKAYTKLVADIKSRAITRHYIALVHGHLNEPKATIRAPIARHPKHRTIQAIVAGGREAVTRYSTIKVLPKHTLVRVELETGRTHQIRVHFQAIGHPVAGDAVYGKPGVQIPGLSRQFLHATELKFNHPVTNKALMFQSPLPEDLQSALTQLSAGSVSFSTKKRR